MIYILFLVISSIYLSTLSNYKQSGYWKLIGYSCPVLLFWILIVGCQYGIGTDYFSYIDIFEGKNFDYISGIRGEYVFSAIVQFLMFTGMPPQWGFIIIAIIEVLLLFYIMHESVDNKFIYLFFFTFICLGGTFHNQMNGLRQYLAIYIVSTIVCLLCNRRFFIALLLSVLTCFVHKSSAIILPIIFLIYQFRFKDSFKWLIIILSIGIILSFVFSNQILSLIIPYFDMYSHYFTSDGVEEYGIIQKFTKYIYIPIFVLAIYRYPYFNLCPKRKWLFVFGIYGFAMKLSVMSLTTVSRMGLYLEIISCIPIVYLLIYVYQKHWTKKYIFLLLYLLAPYAVKVLVMKTGEYSFDSIFFHWNQLQ